MTAPLISWLILIGLLPLAIGLTRLMIYLAPKLGLIDTPSERRIHKTVIPRAGGIAVYITAMIGLSLLYLTGHPFSDRIDANWMIHFALASGIIFVIGVIDDRRGMSAWIKLGGQVLAAMVLFLHQRGDAGNIMGFEVPLIVDLGIHVAWTVLLVNAFNLIDGMDGLCAGLGIISLTIISVFIVVTSSVSDAFLAGVMIMALAGFLRYNFPPARIFLGDTGSMLIGFFIASVGASVVSKHTVMAGILLPLLVGGVPLLDVALAIWRRGAKRIAQSKPGQAAIRIFDPDCEHLHHRILGWGFTHRQAVGLIYGIASLISLLALVPVLGGANMTTISAMLLMMLVLIGLRYIAPIEFMASGQGLRAMVRRPRSSRIMVLAYFLYDVTVLSIAAFTATWLVSKSLREDALSETALSSGMIFVFCSIIALRLARAHARRWTRASVHDFAETLLWLYCGIGFSFGLQAMTHADFSYRSAVFHLSAGVIATALILIPRSLGFFLQEGVIDTMHRKRRLTGKRSQRTTILYGAGDLGELFICHLRLSQPEAWAKDHFIGFLDDSEELSGRRMRGFPILGTLNQLPAIVEKTGANSILVTSSVLSAYKRKELSECCEDLDIELRHWQPDLEPGLIRSPDVPIKPEISVPVSPKKNFTAEVQTADLNQPTY
ncbi:hypothetical protein ACFQY0_13130 [Haloferula chungangensis]|uniref:Undecaprenyl/decaprenyl-phosphate alpha-N-acetylglucosaminyl 1-phosphate transferase n=1 Tax=Haloferula chungangensis TaxID=1048331 RepID=A0ABW2LAF2_9BACT